MNVEKKVLITGASGLIGLELSLALLAKGWSLTIFGRRTEAQFRGEFTFPCTYYQWADPVNTPPPTVGLDVRAVINLMGEPISGPRWSKTQKKILEDSRIASTRNLVSALLTHNPHLGTFVSSSAIGYYGDRGDESLSEKSSPSEDFLGSLCKNWEAEALRAPGRCVIVRTGIVLSDEGGALAKMVPIFENGLGGQLGKGKQWMSWIHLSDLVSIFLEALQNPKMNGAYNGVSPSPSTNREFTDTLAKQLKVGKFLPVPSLALRIVMGQMAEIALASQRVLPESLEKIGFRFKFSTLLDALEDIYGWKQSKHDRMYKNIQWVNKKREPVFQFFSSEKNLELLTPKFLNFHVVKKSTVEMNEGTLIEYRLKIHGIPTKWVSKITLWNPGHKFKDFQVTGPYSKWDHTHGFYDLAGGTLLTDQVIYRLPLASFGGNIGHSLVFNDIKKIFSYRRHKILELFG
jgi:uncharacterized protein (TIGR01777 family)